MQVHGRKYCATALAAVILLLAGTAGAASKDEEQRFLAEVRQDVKKKDIKALLGLVCWDGAGESAKKIVERHMQDVVKRQPKDIGLESWSDFPFKATLKVSHKLRFGFGNGESGGMPVGEKEGRLMIAAPMEN